MINKKIVELAPENDRFTIDRDSITDNAAAKFVPPVHNDDNAFDNSQPDSKISQPKTGDFSTGNTQSTIKQSRLRPTAVFQPQKPKDEKRSELRNEIAASATILKNSDKLDVLNDRLPFFERGLVSHGKIKSPAELKEFELSSLAGKQTVYGIANFGRQAVKGFDVAHHENKVDSWFDLIVPIVDRPEFPDSIASSLDDRLTGLNVNVASDGIQGLQGIFENVQGQEKTGAWVGQPPSNGKFESIRTSNSNIFGIVVYRNQLSAVGLRLIVRKKLKD